eukprot:TRINITY_DN1444_c0_g1_i2.p1 TRINITY_DN1444_c0_g1~~TRINITY_DN1444_c0_g1_i2.p1  ORF type:complete len:270 (+),score=34.59 TRINITY_DN1444_c0_g1_i2:114-812(+)
MLKLIHRRVINVKKIFARDLELGLLIDRESLVKRYLGEQFLDFGKEAQDIQTMTLALRGFASHAWTINQELRYNPSATRPLFPIFPSKETIDDVEKASTKKERVKKMHRIISFLYRDILVHPFKPVIIGEDCIRIHVKKMHQLSSIFFTLTEFMDHMAELNESPILMSLPLSMKSRQQVKGFYVYLKFKNPEAATTAIAWFENHSMHSVWYKVEVAVPKNWKSKKEKSTELA